MTTATVALVVGSVVAAGVLACSAKHDPAPGELLLAIDSNLKVPDDIDEIGVAVATADGSVVSTDQLYGMAPAGDAKFPATLAIIRGTSGPLDIKVAGYKSGAAFALREVVTTIPSDRTAILRMDLNWLDNHTTSGSGATGASVRSLSGTCGDGQTSVAGTCGSFQLDSATLHTFTGDSVVASDDPAACMNVTDCLLGGGVAGGSASVPVSALTGGTAADGTPQCTVTPPGVAGAFNVGLVLAPGGDGWCNATSCVIPLENDPVEGWQLETDGVVSLPAAVCTNTKIVSLVFTPVTDDCPQYVTTHPACQNYGKDGGTVGPGSEAGMDATLDSATGDGAIADGAPPPDGQVTDGQATDSSVPVVDDSYAIGGYNFIGFASNQSETTVMTLVRPQDGGSEQIVTWKIDPTSGLLDKVGGLLPLPVEPTASAIDMAATDGVFALSSLGNVQSFTAPTVLAPALADAGYFSSGTTTDPSSLIYLPQDGGARLTFGNVANPLGATKYLAWQQTTGAFVTEALSPGPATALAYDPVSGNYAIAENDPSLGNTDLPYVITVTSPSDTAPATHSPAATEGSYAAIAVAFPSTDTLAWWVIDANGTPHLAAAPSMATRAGGGTEVTQTTGFYNNGPRSMVGGNGNIYYIGTNQHVYRVSFAAGAATSAPVDEAPVLGSVQAIQLGMTATHLLYTDGTMFYRYSLKDLP